MQSCFCFSQTGRSTWQKSYALRWRAARQCCATVIRILPWPIRATGGLQPDLTLLLDLPVRCGLMRAGERNRQEGLVVSEGRFDAESLDFHTRVRQGYRALAEEEPERFAIVDASQPPEDVVLQCRSAIESHLRQRGRGLE